MSTPYPTSPRVPFLEKVRDTYASFTASGRVLFLFFAGLCVVSSVALVYLLNASLLVATPARGGSLTEGILGSPRFINPVLALSDADRDLTVLVYSGLLRTTPDGGYEPDLAESYEISDDGLTYVFTLRDDATFHDGTRVSAQDVAFTVQKIQDPGLKSPVRANWDGVAVETAGEKTVRFILKNPYAPFIRNLTLGVLPRHLWEGVSTEEFAFSKLNAEPVGSGPYRVQAVERTPSGIPSSYQLEPFRGYVLGKPYLRLTLRFYQSEDALVAALTDAEIDAASGLSPNRLAELKSPVISTPLGRVFGVFFNQNQAEVLRQKSVREALDAAIDRHDLVEKVLGGYGTPLYDPVPLRPALVADAAPRATGIEAAQAILKRDGWKPNDQGILQKTTGSGSAATTQTLSFELATANVPELRAAAEYVRDVWKKVGAEVEVHIFEAGDLSQNVIRPRKYDALLFGEVTGRELDLFAFWHSSQRNDPGLNVAGYANAAADKALEELRATRERAQREALYKELIAELRADVPAVFLYAPDFVYSMPNDIRGIDLGLTESSSDRFMSVGQWHREVEYVWPIFVGQQ